MGSSIYFRIIIDFFMDIVRYPYWWYTKGLLQAITYSIELVQSANNRLAPRLWLKYIFVPMFGQYDWQGRLISFFMRLVNLIGRSIAIVFTAGMGVFLAILWVIVPLIVIYMLILSLFST